MFVGFDVFYVLGSQVTRVFWLVFCSDNDFVGTFICFKCQLGDFIEEGEGHLVVKGVWVSWSLLRIFIGVQGSQNVVDCFELREEHSNMFRVQFDGGVVSLTIIGPGFSRPQFYDCFSRKGIRIWRVGGGECRCDDKRINRECSILFR